MNHKNISKIVKAAICICAEDGIVSETEENSVYKLLVERFPDYSQDNFNEAINDFFSSKKQLEDYLKDITDLEEQKFTLELGKISAASDGLDFRENIAVEKAIVFWKIKK